VHGGPTEALQAGATTALIPVALGLPQIAAVSLHACDDLWAQTFRYPAAAFHKADGAAGARQFKGAQQARRPAADDDSVEARIRQRV
jgi:hypothetical protein